MFKLHDDGNKLTASITWHASQKMIDEAIVATGKHPSPQHHMDFDMTELRTAQRELILQYRSAVAGENGGVVYRGGPKLIFDHEPTFDEIVEALSEWEAEQEEKRRQEREEVTERVGQMQIIDDLNKKIWALEKAGDLAGLEAFQIPDDVPYIKNKPRPADVRREAINKFKKAQREADKRTWIEVWGSDHLKRACLDEGFNCQRLYVTERAAREAPGFQVDFHGNARWNERSCPTGDALDALDEARSLNLGEPRIVWLTFGPDSEDEIEHLEQEAVVIRDYLGRYDLIRIVN
jgi:hypothetical protein